MDVATKLWDSWADDAVIADTECGAHVGADKVRKIDHRGTYFRVDGPLNVQCSPQGYPLLVQAGAGEDGREFAARYAEAREPDADRGLFRTAYTGSTLREHYGLPRPASRLFEEVDTSAGHLGIALTEVR